MAENLTILTDVILEKTSPKITATLKDEDGVAMGAGSLDTLTLTLYNLDDAAGTIINGRNSQNVLNANNVTLTSLGILTWLVQPLDTVIVGYSNYEKHRAVIEWTYSAGKNGKYIIDMVIRNLIKTV